MTGPVVVGIDDFEHSDRLIAIAADEALARGASLWLPIALAENRYTRLNLDQPPLRCP